MNLIRWGTVVTLIVTGSLLGAAEQQAGSQPRESAGIVARSGSRALATVRPDLVGIIQGNALNSTNGQLPNQPVRLRDARFGRIIDTQITDQSGIFTFRGIDSGTYIVEMIGDDQTILAASQVLNINAGEAVSAVVKLPFRLPPFAGILGRATTSAAAITAQAVASSIVAVTTVGEPTCPR
jgi:hypothetical protein